MRIVLAVLLAILPACVAAAQSADQPRKASPKPGTQHRSAGSNPCAKYGPGFVRVGGSDTCVKLGGSVSVEGGGSQRR